MRHRTLQLFLTGVVGLVPFMNCEAGQGTGQVARVYQHYQMPSPNGSNAFMFALNTGQGSGCNATIRWAVDAALTEGKAVMATILMAHATGRTVTVEGKGVCDIHPDAETVSYIVVHP